MATYLSGHLGHKHFSESVIFGSSADLLELCRINIADILYADDSLHYVDDTIIKATV